MVMPSFAPGDPARARAVRAVLFDMGNTLLEFETVPWEELNRRGAEATFDMLADAAAAAGIARDEFLRLFDSTFARFESDAAPEARGLHLFDVFAELLETIGLPRDDRALVEAMTARHYDPIVAQVSLYPEVSATLDALRSAGVRLGIVSNTIWPAEYHLADLRRFGILDRFDAIVFSTDLGVSKPHPRIFEACLERIGVAAADALFVGDRLYEDVSGAQRVGMRGVLKRHPQRTPDPRFRPDARIDALSDLLPLVLPNGHARK